MMYHYLNRHKILRFAICFFAAFLCCFGFIAKPLVVAHALAVTGTIIFVTGSLLAALGISFAVGTELQKGSMTFYNACKAGAMNVKAFIDEQAAKFSTGSAYVMTVPVAIMNTATLLAWKTFPKNAQPVEDTSAIDVPLWRSKIGLNINKMGWYNSKDYVFITSAIPNVLTDNSSNVNVPAIPISMDDFKGYLSGLDYSIPSVNPYSVARYVGVSGLTYDYRTHIRRSATGNLIFEVSENGSCIGSKVVPIDGIFNKIVLSSPYFYPGGTLYFPFKMHTIINEVVTVSDYYLLSIPAKTPTTVGFSISQYCTFSGIVDGRTGVVDVPRVGYIPDTSICANNAIKDALDKTLAQNPAFPGVDVSIPAAEADLINAKWEQVVSTQQDYIDSLREAIDALENTKPGDGTGEGTITGTVEVAIGDIVLPNLQTPALITTLFPFCIPFDLARAVDALKAPPLEPHFEIPLKYGDIMDETIVLDLTWLDFVIRFIRWAELFGFGLGLAVLTRNYIKW